MSRGWTGFVSEAPPRVPAVRSSSPPTTVRIWGALGIVYVVWGSTYLAIKWSLETMPPLLSAAVRFLAAGVIMAGILTIAHGPKVWRLSSRAVRNGVACGLLTLLGGNGVVVLAETEIPSSLAALLVATTPLWVIVIRRVLGEQVKIATFVGVLVGLGGVALLFLPGGGSKPINAWYALIVVGAALSWATGSMLATRSEVPSDPLVLAGIEMLGGGAGLLVLAALHGEFSDVDLGSITTKSWLSLVYLILFGSLVAFTAYIWVFANAPSSLVTTYAYVNPVVAVTLGVSLNNESLSMVEMVGAAVIVVAVGLVITVEGRAARRSMPPAVPVSGQVATGAVP
ncbi:MAG: EamA family transporter [Pseudonocardiales bacterium]|nr:EamA family transporter [Pseudonocardiales bacterium]